MSDIKSVLNKIQKILALAEGAGTEAEAEAAMGMAQTLLAKHNLSMSDVDTHDAAPQETVGSDDKTELPKRNFQWEMTIYGAISELYFCDYFMRTRRINRQNVRNIVVVGKASNIQIVHAVAQSIIGLGKSLAEKQKKAGGHPATWATSFKLGFSLRIRQRANEQIQKAKQGKVKDETGTALVIAPLYDTEAKANNAHMRSIAPNLKVTNDRVNVRDYGAYSAGMEAGNKASLSSNGVSQCDRTRIGGTK